MRLVFDRGTIVLDGVPPGMPAKELPGARWDPRIGGYRAPASRHRELREKLAVAGVGFCDAAHAPQAPRAGLAAPPLRPYQEAAVAAWERAGHRGLVALPTGSGKTRVAVAAIARLGAAALCLVPTRILLEQWRCALEAAFGGAIGCYGDGARVIAPITVATLASAERHMPQIGNRFELLVVDEVHHAVGYEEVLSMATATARLGLTATPPRDPDAAAALARLVGPTVYERGLGDLAGRYLSPFDVQTVELELTERERGQYEREMRVFRELWSRYRVIDPNGSWASFVRAAERSDEGRRAVAAWRRARRLLGYTEAKRAAVEALLERHRDTRVLVFTSDNAAAYAIARERLIMPMTCDIGRAERDEALARFAAGELHALVSARVLNEGVDVPDADVAIIVGGSLGEREHVQRIGRLLRPRAGKRALVYELVTLATAEVWHSRRRSRGLAGELSA